MSDIIVGNCAKGAICRCLDDFSKGRGARSRVARLRAALAALAPTFSGLTAVFDQYLLSHVITDAAERARVVRHLQQHWFDPGSPDPYFPGLPVASIYAEGVIRALDLALAGRPLLQLNAWWLPGFPEVKLVSLADIDKAGVTIGGRVTLLILTPQPKVSGRPTRTPIHGDTAEAYVTGHRNSQVETIDVRSGRPTS